MGETVKISCSKTFKDTGMAALCGRTTSCPSVCRNMTQSPLQSRSEAASEMRCTSVAVTAQVRASEEVLWQIFFFSVALHAAPWQLKTPITPVYLFMFHIFNKLIRRLVSISTVKTSMECYALRIVYGAHLEPSRVGSEKRQSRVGLPGSRARRIDPSGKTSFFSNSKLCFPGTSLQVQKIEHLNYSFCKARSKHG